MSGIAVDQHCGLGGRSHDQCVFTPCRRHKCYSLVCTCTVQVVSGRGPLEAKARGTSEVCWEGEAGRAQETI